MMLRPMNAVLTALLLSLSSTAHTQPAHDFAGLWLGSVSLDAVSHAEGPDPEALQPAAV